MGSLPYSCWLGRLPLFHFLVQVFFFHLGSARRVASAFIGTRQVECRHGLDNVVWTWGRVYTGLVPEPLSVPKHRRTDGMDQCAPFWSISFRIVGCH